MAKREKKQSDFITLSGEQLPGKRLQKLTSGLDFPATTLVPLIGLIAYPTLHHFLLYTSFATGALINRLLCNDIMNATLKSSFGQDHFNLLIDKKPDENTPPPKAEHVAAAQKIRLSEFIYASFATGVTTWAVLADSIEIQFAEESLKINTDAPLSNEYITAALLGLCTTYLLRSFQNVYRFNKVASLKWRITDQPPPEKVKESLLSKAWRWADGVIPKPKPHTKPVPVDVKRSVDAPEAFVPDARLP